MATPAAIFRHEGFAWDWTNDTGDDVAAGDIVDLGTCVGIATRPILDGETGALQVLGVYEVKKYAGEALALGAKVYYDAGTGTATGTIGYSEARMGLAARAAAGSDTTAWVYIDPAFGG